MDWRPRRYVLIAMKLDLAWQKYLADGDQIHQRRRQQGPLRRYGYRASRCI
jgi:hypothetical protein